MDKSGEVAVLALRRVWSLSGKAWRGGRKQAEAVAQVLARVPGQEQEEEARWSAHRERAGRQQPAGPG